MFTQAGALASGLRNPSAVEVHCDEPADRHLFLQLCRLKPRLAKIQAACVSVYPKTQDDAKLTDTQKAIKELHVNDRSDWIFTMAGAPILVVELTRHAYTGDNGLQRFVRIGSAGEHKVPFIYFGPLSRVRDDELDDPDVAKAHARRLTSDLFEGMQRIAELSKTAQVYAEWKTNGEGLPCPLPADPTDEQLREIYGELAELIDYFLFVVPEPGQSSHLTDPVVQRSLQKLSELASDTNTRTSEVKFNLDAKTLAHLLDDPRRVMQLGSMNSYFSKGKPDKLLAKHAIQLAHVEWVQFSDGSRSKVSPDQRRSIIQQIMADKNLHSGAVLYYTGYKWRSDPHAGVLVNIDYRLCRQDATNGEPQRGRGLVVLYPRISLAKDGSVAMELAQADASEVLAAEFESRYGAIEGKEKRDKTLSSSNLYGVWSNGTKQARVFRRHADVIIVNDGLVLGDSMAHVAKPT